MRRITLFCSLLLFSGLAGGVSAGDPGVAAGLDRFSGSLYEQLARNSSGNLVVSPFSISSALFMALAGARGDTAAEISKVLGQGEPGPERHAALAALVNQITSAANTGGNQLLTGSGLWVQKDFAILPDFRDTLRDVYHAPPARLDFTGDPEGSRTAINRWTQQQTGGKIPGLFAPGALDSRTRLVLSSAIYFYGKWEHAFRRSETRPAPFTLPSGATEPVDFMNQTGRFGYAETASGRILEMRYAGTGLAFDILLPRKQAPIAEMDSGLNPAKLAGWLGALANRPVQVAIPKFRVESQFPLAATLSSLGMPTAFSEGADFSGIDDRRDLQLTKVIHKAYIDVAEDGTEAAAATGAAVGLVSMRVTPDPVFRADHPFVFLIRDTRTGLVLFTGRLTDPKR